MDSERSLYKVTQVIWYIFYILESLLLIRFILKLLGANASAGFTDLVYTLSAIPLAPFRFVFGSGVVGSSVFEWSTILAMLIYWVLAWGIIKLIVMARPIDRVEAEVGLRMQDN